MKKRFIPLMIWLVVTTACHALAADEIVIAADDEGAVEDSILDGFPSLASYDGVGDFGGNALGVALQTGTTEERAILEFPLSGLGPIDGSGIDEATLTINIDDVVSTFGPGTGFDGKASSTIAVHAYVGDGAVTLADFARVGLEPLAEIDTTAAGVITDATLAVSGPVSFEVDVTDAMRAALDEEAAYLGFVLATDDNQSGTSIDNLGANAAGPPGVGGSRMPFLSIAIAEAPTTTTTSTTVTSTTTTSTSTTSTSMEPDSFCGDANGDGNLTAGDALFILRAAVGGTTCPLALCDADGSARITAGDAMRVLRVSVGSNASLVCKN